MIWPRWTLAGILSVTATDRFGGSGCPVDASSPVGIDIFIRIYRVAPNDIWCGSDRYPGAERSTPETATMGSCLLTPRAVRLLERFRMVAIAMSGSCCASKRKIDNLGLDRPTGLSTLVHPDRHLGVDHAPADESPWQVTTARLLSTSRAAMLPEFRRRPPCFQFANRRMWTGGYDAPARYTIAPYPPPWACRAFPTLGRRH